MRLISALLVALFVSSVVANDPHIVGNGEELRESTTEEWEEEAVGALWLAEEQRDGIDSSRNDTHDGIIDANLNMYAMQQYYAAVDQDMTLQDIFNYTPCINGADDAVEAAELLYDEATTKRNEASALITQGWVKFNQGMYFQAYDCGHNASIACEEAMEKLLAADAKIVQANGFIAAGMAILTKY
jgi:hypothetical protein